MHATRRTGLITWPAQTSFGGPPPRPQTTTTTTTTLGTPHEQHGHVVEPATCTNPPGHRRRRRRGRAHARHRREQHRARSDQVFDPALRQPQGMEAQERRRVGPVLLQRTGEGLTRRAAASVMEVPTPNATSPSTRSTWDARNTWAPFFLDRLADAERRKAVFERQHAGLDRRRGRQDRLHQDRHPRPPRRPARPGSVQGPRPARPPDRRLGRRPHAGPAVGGGGHVDDGEDEAGVGEADQRQDQVRPAQARPRRGRRRELHPLHAQRRRGGRGDVGGDAEDHQDARGRRGPARAAEAQGQEDPQGPAQPARAGAQVAAEEGDGAGAKGLDDPALHLQLEEQQGLHHPARQAPRRRRPRPPRRPSAPSFFVDGRG